MINHPEINPLANALQDSVNALQINIDLKNRDGNIANRKTQEAEDTFKDFMHRYKLANFIDKSAAMIDVAISTTGPWFIKLWNETVPLKSAKRLR